MTKVSGKGYRSVPIIFTPDMEEAMATLMKLRNKFVPSENVFFFAIPFSTSSVNFYQTLQKVAKRAQICHPELITSTRLRKYAATMIQVRTFFGTTSLNKN